MLDRIYFIRNSKRDLLPFLIITHDSRPFSQFRTHNSQPLKAKSIGENMQCTHGNYIYFYNNPSFIIDDGGPAQGRLSWVCVAELEILFEAWGAKSLYTLQVNNNIDKFPAGPACALFNFHYPSSRILILSFLLWKIWFYLFFWLFSNAAGRLKPLCL